MKNSFFQILRFLFSALLLTTAIGKLLDNRGFAEVILTYEFGFSPGHFLLVFALAFSLFEMYLGLRIGRDQGRKVNGLLLMGLHGGYTALAVVTLQRGIELENCGCFGIFLARPMTLMTVVEDGALLFLSFLYWKLAAKTKKRR